MVDRQNFPVKKRRGKGREREKQSLHSAVHISVVRDPTHLASSSRPHPSPLLLIIGALRPLILVRLRSHLIDEDGTSPAANEV